MPINEEEWNKKSKFEEDKEKVYDFLEKHYPQAFTAGEIFKNVDLPKIDKEFENLIMGGFDWAYLENILKELKEEGKIESKNINGNVYYRVKK